MHEGGEGAGSAAGSGQQLVFDPLLHKHETEAARFIGELLAAHAEEDEMVTEGLAMALAALREEADAGEREIRLNAEQLRGVENSLLPISVITGGPGTGKTTCVDAILDLHMSAESAVRVLLSAPTGKAVYRMKQSVGFSNYPNVDVRTMHRFISEVYITSSLPGSIVGNYDVIICDEASMIGTSLFYEFLRTILEKNPGEKSIVFLGDVNQLPSIGAGCVFQQLLQVGSIPRVTLTHRYRQTVSDLFDGIEDDLRGVFPSTRNGDGSLVFRHVPGNRVLDNAEITRETLAILQQTLSDEGEGRSFDDVFVILPTNKISKDLEESIRELVNPSSDRGNSGNGRGGIGGAAVRRRFRKGDYLCQTKNDYTKGELFNGMTGRVVETGETSFTVQFSDGTKRVYQSDDAGTNLSLSYVNTIHKAHGSESAIVIFVYDGQSLHYPDKRLLYTALSRAKVRCVAVGPMAAFRQCLSKTVPPRYSHLAAFIGEKICV